MTLRLTEAVQAFIEDPNEETQARVWTEATFRTNSPSREADELGQLVQQVIIGDRRDEDTVTNIAFLESRLAPTGKERAVAGRNNGKAGEVEDPLADEHPEPDRDIDEFLDSPDPEYDWLVPQLLERGDRLIITGPEGGGKSTFLRQMAVQMSAGIHPFTLDDMAPLAVMYLDAENSERQVRRKIRPLRHQAGKRLETGQLRIRVKPDGLNLAGALDQEWFELRIRANRPDVVLCGPLYKLADGDPTEEKVAKPVALFLDQMRVKYGFAMVIEAHTPHASTTSGKRPERPYGWSGWLRWPEFGLHLSDKGFVTHWRGARDEREWPALLSRGGEWPWMPETDKRLVTWARILDIVKDHGPLSVRDIAEKLGGQQYRSQVQRAKENNRLEWDELMKGEPDVD